MFKIKIDCTDIKQLYYKNPNKFKKNTKFDFDFKDIFKDIIEKCYVLERIINKSKTNSKFTCKSLEFHINKELDINELRQFITMLQNIGFKSTRNTSVQLIDIRDNNNHIYYQKINYNKKENDNEKLILSPFKELNKRPSKYNQIALYTRKNYLNP